MSKSVQKFTDEIERVVSYFRKEFELNYAEAIGALELVSHKLKQEAYEIDDEDDEE